MVDGCTSASESNPLSFDLKQCYGCNACGAVCPADAIFFTKTKLGFFYPEVDSAKCIHCGLCKKVCPCLNKPQDRDVYHSFAVCGFNKNSLMRKASRSGGVFPVFAQACLDAGGVVYGAAIGDDNVTRHIRIDARNSSALNALSGSKYVESLLDRETMRCILSDLNNGQKVLFSGTGCQCYGVKLMAEAFKKADNLLLVSVLCFGSMSPEIVLEYLKSLSGNEKRIVSFRHKGRGWDSHYELVRIDGRYHSSNALAALYNSGAFERASCYQCSFACKNQYSDITLCDAWGLEKRWDREEVKKGVSLVLLNTEKGLRELYQIESECCLENVNADDVLNEVRRPNLFRHRLLTKSAEKKRDAYLNNASSFQRIKFSCWSRWQMILFRDKIYRVLSKIKRCFFRN